MASVLYVAVVERAGDGYSVFFPDVPGCASAGDTLNEVVVNAGDALASHIALSHQHGDEIGEPRPLEDIPVDPEVEEYGRFLVPADLPGKAVRLNITLDEGLVAAIDRVAKNRSGFLADAARDALARRREMA